MKQRIEGKEKELLEREKELDEREKVRLITVLLGDLLCVSIICNI